MDPVSMMLITVPIFFPLIKALGVDPLWFGLFMLMALEMSQTTPPFGLLLFVMLGVAPKGTSLKQVAVAAAPFLVCDAVLVLLIAVFPALVLFLPGIMR
ncbi:MAG: TRAP transporter large permease subunit [Burkholderiaceae bacterium]